MKGYTCMIHYIKEKDSEKTQNTLFTLCIVLSPVLNVYALQGYGLGFPLLTLCLFINLIRHNKSLCILKLDNNSIYIIMPMIFLLISGLISLAYNYSAVSKILGRSFFIIIYTFIIIQSKKLVNFSLAKTVMRVVAFVVVVGTVIQILTYFITGNVLQLYIPGLSTAVENLNQSIVLDGSVFRPKSIFNEPSHIAYYISLCLTIELFVYKKGSLFWIVFDSIGLLLTLSGTGVALLALIWCMFLASERAFIKSLYVVFGIVFIFLIIIQTGFWEHVLYSMGRLQVDTNRVTSFLSIFDSMSSIEKVIGVGIGNTTVRFASLFQSNSSFMSGFGRILIEGGVVCAFVYILCYLKLIISIKFPYKSFVILLFVLNFAENTIFGLYYSLIFMWIYCNDI